jgi:hypothetical protein
MSFNIGSRNRNGFCRFSKRRPFCLFRNRSQILARAAERRPSTASRKFTFLRCKLLEACAASEGGKLTIAHAVSISSGGAPTILVADEKTFVFPEVANAAAVSAE